MKLFYECGFFKSKIIDNTGVIRGGIICYENIESLIRNCKDSSKIHLYIIYTYNIHRVPYKDNEYGKVWFVDKDVYNFEKIS